MARLRRDTQDTTSSLPPLHRPLRIIASGTLFLTHTLSVPSHPAPSAVVRAHQVIKSRGGAASTCLSLLAQFPAVDAMLVASLAGNDEGRMIVAQLEQEGVSTRYSKIWDGASVPSAWVIHSDETDTQSIINHNPLPDITHEEFVSLLGPILIPENYAHLNNGSPPVSLPAQLSAPFDWLHFEGRSVKTTLNNMTGVEGLARERKWRSQCVFSLDVGRKSRQGVHALMPHADVVFLNAHYAKSHAPAHASTPRAYLLSLAASSSVAPHALLVAYWGTAQGSALLSLPTREYFQSSGWVPPPPSAPSVSNRAGKHMSYISTTTDGRAADESIGTSSAFWADGDEHTTESEFSLHRLSANTTVPDDDNDGDNDSDGTETGRDDDDDDEVVDEVGAQEAFVAGMIWALSRRVLPGEPYVPSGTSPSPAAASTRSGSSVDMGKWRLEECLKFATELAGRKAKCVGWDGLADEMARTGWLEA